MKIVRYNKFINDAYIVREKVFIIEQGFIDEIDFIDSYATHIVIYDKDNPIGTCRVFLDNNEYKLGRLAVLKEYRGEGIGKILVNEAEKHVKTVGGKSIILHSQLQAKGFYNKAGYTEFGEIDYEENHPHIWMRKVL